MRRVWMAMVGGSLLAAGCAPQMETALPTPSLPPAATAAPAAATTATSTPLPSATPQPTPTEEVKSVTFTIVYDNNAPVGARDYDPALRAAWGFACLVETGEATVLFDTGGDGLTLLGNMDKLGLDPREIDVVVLSHAHGDHTGGLAGLLDAGARPTVYAPAAFPASFKDSVRARTELVEVSAPLEILSGVHTTGEVGSGIVEQALVVETADGADKQHPLVVLTGCAHPGVVEMVRRAKESVGGEVYLVMGGFHLGSASRQQIATIVEDFQQLGVQRVAPCHCSGDAARELFEEAYGEAFIWAGVGSTLEIGK